MGHDTTFDLSNMQNFS